MASGGPLGLGQLLVLRLVVAVSMASVGALLSVSFKRISHLWLCVLISFAAGALLAVTLLEIIPESFQMVGWKAGIVSVLSGYFVFLIITRYVFHVCPACAATHTEANFKAITTTMIVALGIHSFMDGLAIYSGYLTSSKIGLLILLAVAYHKLPEGMALALVARSSGIGRLKAFSVSFTLEFLTTMAGGLIGFLLLVPESQRWVGYILGHVGGGFLFIVIHALLGEAVKEHPQSTVIAALGGALSVGLIGFLVGVL